MCPSGAAMFPSDNFFGVGGPADSSKFTSPEPFLELNSFARNSLLLVLENDFFKYS